MIEERTFNHYFAAYLRSRRRAWNANPNIIRAEAFRVVRHRESGIVIAEPFADPVIIETEFEPASTVESDAQSRLGVPIDTGDRVFSVLAVKLPAQWRHLPDDVSAITNVLQAQPIAWSVWFLGQDGQPMRWPSSGWIMSSANVLAFAAYRYSVASHRIQQAHDILLSTLEAVAVRIRQMERSGYREAIRTMASVLRQASGEQTWKMAGLILVNALVFHELLAGRGNLSQVPSLEQMRLRQGCLSKQAILNVWQQSLAANYWPIFQIASGVLLPLPDDPAGSLLELLANAIRDSGVRRLLPSRDVLSQIFQRMIDDRGALAAFYTLPETAELLASLAIQTSQAPNGASWDNGESVAKIRVADLACGTGTLLTTVYQRIGWLHEAAGGDARSIHRPMIEHGLIGLDVLPAAVHLTATILSGVYPEEQYNHSQLYIARYGAGKDPSQGVSIGSLELLDNTPQFDVFARLAEPQADPAQAGSAPVDLWHELQRLDLCIMNPPYTRNTNHEGNRATDPFPAFAALGVTPFEAKEMAARLRNLVRGTSIAHGNAGEASMFLALADKFTRPGGTIALVLPLTALMGDSWSHARTALYETYHDFCVVTVAGRGTRVLGFSADTNMAECLLIARKGEAAVSARDKDSRALMISLDRLPSDPVISALLADSISTLVEGGTIRRLEDGPHGGILIKIGDECWGSLVSVPLKWGPGWVGGRVSDFSLAQMVYQFVEHQRAWIPGIAESDAVTVAMCPLSQFTVLGPLHRDINGALPRGPFDVRRRILGEVGTYPILWRHEASREHTMVFEEDSVGEIRPGADPGRVARVVNSMSHLHFNSDWRFNSQALNAQWTERPAIGGRAWPSIQLLPGQDRPEVTKQRTKALLLWLNTTAGSAIRWLWSSRQQPGRGIMTREVIRTLPVLDVRQLTSDQLQACNTLFDQFRTRPMQPLHRVDRDSVRHDLDREFLSGILGWPASWFAPNSPWDIVRRKLAAEPSIHAHHD